MRAPSVVFGVTQPWLCSRWRRQVARAHSHTTGAPEAVEQLPAHARAVGLESVLVHRAQDGAPCRAGHGVAACDGWASCGHALDAAHHTREEGGLLQGDLLPIRAGPSPPPHQRAQRNMRRTIGVEVQARGEDLGDLWRGHHRRKRQPVANACAEVPGEPWAVCDTHARGVRPPRPTPSPFAMVTMSGTTPWFWKPQ